MHKPFYASGFLYHSPSGQILLRQSNKDGDDRLMLFRGKSHNGTDPQTVFQQCVEKTLGISIAPSSIHPVYDYIHPNLGEHFIFYVETRENIPPHNSSDTSTGWIPLAKIAKFAMSEQTRHDIIIGERVIRSLLESSMAQPQFRA